MDYHLQDLIQSEIKLQKNLSHPNILKIYDSLEDDNHLYLIQELIEGGDLYRLLKN